MLQFVFGKPSTGKSYYIFEKISELAKEDKSVILIVPEQYTFETERLILKKLGDCLASKVSVLSFSRLCDEINRNIGGFAKKVLSDSDRVLFMKKALLQSADCLKIWSKYVNSVTFAKNLLDIISEFKTNNITAREILSVCETIEQPLLKAKLNDISTIYEAYDTLINEKFIDPEDKLTNLYKSLLDYKFFVGKYVFLDSFKGFTGQQIKIIERVISQAVNTYLSITFNPDNNRPLNVFTNIKKEIERITSIAEKYNIKVNEPIILNKTNYNSDSLEQLENLISGESTESFENSAITICEAKTIFDEAEFVARTIRNLVRTKNMRFRDFVIIARDAEIYSQAVISACKRNSVQCFYDTKTPVSAFPLAIAVKSAIKALNFSTDNILRFHKTGLGTLNYDEITKLQNYTYIWNINGSLWLKEWDMDTRGFQSKPQNNENISELKEINNLRVKAITPIINFKNNFNSSAVKMCSAIISLMNECDAYSKLTELSTKVNNSELNLSSDYLKGAYDEFINILDCLVNCYGDKNLKIEEFSEAFDLSISLATVGVVPQMLDEVTFGSADRIRPSRPKIAFIIGANQGVFPKISSSVGLLNNFDRKNLIENGITIKDNSIESTIDENFLVYSNLCCPSDALYISYSTQTLSGESLEPSSFISKILREMPCNKFFEPQESIDSINIPETAEAAFNEYCKRRQNLSDAYILSTSLKETKYSSSVDFIEEYVKNNKDKAISKESSNRLFGTDIHMSASKFDTFYKCKFSFLCKYGFNLRKLQPAEFDVMQRGTIVHYVLEQLITEHMNDIVSLTEDELKALTDAYINQYLNMIPGYRSIEDEKLKFLVSRISRSLKEVVIHIAAELSQSDFKPLSCELKIGKGSDIEVNFPYNDGKINLSGSIDRVDEYNGFIRIIDYKTGDKVFKLPDIVFGLNLQMLIYLYAIIRGKGLDDNLAAGILYQPSKRDLKNKGMSMNGLLKYDMQLINAMDKEAKGEYIPAVSLNKDGSLSKRCTSFISSENFTEIFNYIEKLMQKIGNEISSGDFEVNPLDSLNSPACKYCDFSLICGVEENSIKKVPTLDNESVFEIIKEDEASGI